jgi:hypothetical protein
MSNDRRLKIEGTANMKKPRNFEPVVILLDKHFQRPIAASVGSRLLTGDCHGGHSARGLSCTNPSPEFDQPRHVLPADYVRGYLDKSSIDEPQQLPQPRLPTRTMSDSIAHPAARVLDPEHLPPKFQVWAKTRATQLAIDSPVECAFPIAGCMIDAS